MPYAAACWSGCATSRRPSCDRHLFSIASARDGAGRFPVRTTGWEAEALQVELEAPGLVAWYRNPASGQHALAIPYEYGEQTRLFHPDFMFFHQDGDDVVIDLVDPHRHNADEAGAKWAALATYAVDHPDHLRRVLAVIRDSSGALRSLDLRGDGMAERLKAATDGAQVEALFDELGTNY